MNWTKVQLQVLWLAAGGSWGVEEIEMYHPAYSLSCWVGRREPNWDCGPSKGVPGHEITMAGAQTGFEKIDWKVIGDPQLAQEHSSPVFFGTTATPGVGWQLSHTVKRMEWSTR